MLYKISRKTIFILAIILIFIFAGILIVNQKNQRVAECRKLGDEWTSFYDARIFLSFCYKKEWGEPKLMSDAFTNLDGGTGVMTYVYFSLYSYPLIGYSDLDYFNVGGTHDSILGVEEIDLSLNKADLEEVILASSSAKIKSVDVEKFKIGEYSGLKIISSVDVIYGEESQSYVDYYLPKVTIKGKGYDLRVAAPIKLVKLENDFNIIELENDLTILVQSLIF